MKNVIVYQHRALGFVSKTKRIFFFLVLMAFVFGPLPVYSHSQHGSNPGNSPKNKKDLLRLGSTVYKHMCVHCHGQDGNGGGKAIAYLYPWPRDFRKGVFKYRTTPFGSLPQDKDIYRTISRGIPGTSMPAWGGALSKDETLGVVEYIKSFSKRFEKEKPKEAIVIGDVPATDAQAIKSGQDIYQEMRCSRCHGTDLKGDGPIADELYDIWDHPVSYTHLTLPTILLV